jgi:dihydrofolate reductase
MMGKLIESTFVTLDGVIGDPHVWGMPYWDGEHHGYGATLMADAEALLLGRETYEAFAEVWPQRSGDEYSDKLNAMQKYVASRTLTETTWNAQLLEGDVAEAVARLKAETSGTLLKFGTGELDKTLIAGNLLDELHLWVFPVIAGSGERLMDGLIDTTHFHLADTHQMDNGIVVHVLTPDDADQSSDG